MSVEPVPLYSKAHELVGYMCPGHHQVLLIARMGEEVAELVVRSCEECGPKAPPPRCPKHDTVIRDFCIACWREKQRAEAQRAFAMAEKIPANDYDGLVTDGDDRWRDASEVEDDELLVAADGTRYLWATSPEPASVDLKSECAESWLQDHHEDAFDQVDLDELRQAQEHVDRALAKVCTYHEDRTRAVVWSAVEAEQLERQAEEDGHG